MSNNRSIVKRIFIFLLAVAVLTGSVFAFVKPGKAFAFFDEKTATKYGKYSAEHEIEPCSLFIGTYIIHKDSLEDFYQKAIDTQGESGQYSIYYKSEMSANQWRDITSADGGIRDISEGDPVPESDLKDLYITYVVGSDGSVYDHNGDLVNPFNTPDPYNIKNLPEFSTVKSLYEERYKEDSKNHSDQYYYKFITAFFDLDLSNDITDECDEQIDALWPAYRALKASGQDDLATILYKLIGQIDAKRRVEIYYQLAESAEESWKISENKISENSATDEDEDADEEDKKAKSYVQAMIEVLGSETVYKEWAFNNKHYSMTEVIDYLKGNKDSDAADREDDDSDKEEDSFDLGNIDVELEDTKYADGTSLDYQEFRQDKDMVDCFSNALKDCQTTYSDNLSKKIEESDSIIGKAEYKRVISIVDSAKGGLTGDMISQLEELNRLYHINDGVIAEAAKELELLDNELLPQASEDYENKVLGGVCDAYTEGLSSGISEITAQGILDEQKGDAESARTVLEGFVNERIKRLDSAAGVEYCDERINWAEGLFAGIVDDAFKKDANASATDHKLFLKDKRKSIIDSNKDLQSDHDKLVEQKDNLNAQKQKALDDQDQNLANKIDAKLGEIDRALGETAGDDDDMNKDLADKAKSKILNGEDASSQLNAIAESGDTKALSDLLSDMEEAGADDGSLSDVKDALEDAKDVASGAGGNGAGGNGAGGNGAGGNGAGGNGVGLSEAQMLAIIADILGAEFKDLDDEGKLCAAVAAGWFGEMGANTAQQLAITWINQCAKEKNRYVFSTLIESGMEYAPLERIATSTDYRYVFEPRRREATLTDNKGGQYLFISGTTQVTVQGTETSYMKNKARFGENTIYIDEEATKSFFGMVVEPVDGSIYSGLMTGAMRKKSIELLEAFKNAL